MKITISSLEVGSISNIGSLNIGKTILSNNRASITKIPFPEEVESVALHVPRPGELAAPRVGEINPPRPAQTNVHRPDKNVPNPGGTSSGSTSPPPPGS